VKGDDGASGVSNRHILCGEAAARSGQEDALPRFVGARYVLTALACDEQQARRHGQVANLLSRTEYNPENRALRRRELKVPSMKYGEQRLLAACRVLQNGGLPKRKEAPGRATFARDSPNTASVASKWCGKKIETLPLLKKYIQKKRDNRPGTVEIPVDRGGSA
jgi:hypothetical protein